MVLVLEVLVLEVLVLVVLVLEVELDDGAIILTPVATEFTTSIGELESVTCKIAFHTPSWVLVVVLKTHMVMVQLGVLGGIIGLWS